MAIPAALATLPLLEFVLGMDNIIFISIFDRHSCRSSVAAPSTDGMEPGAGDADPHR
ncbi:MAG: hypothetical protein II007_10360 [Gammaproteobacteria bacterium]|nr:hypothetical protein [Gammaproteobacteria bacterium]